jgi:SAM-dependent methyltransferase
MERHSATQLQEILDRSAMDAKRLGEAEGAASVSPPSVDLAASYDTYIGTGLYSRRYPRSNANMARLLGGVVGAGDCVLDFGCGDGRYIGKLLDAGARVIGYDISPVAIETVATTYAGAIQAGRLQTVGFSLDALTRAVAPGRCDVALLMFGVLGHIRGDAQRVETLRTVRSLLKPGGRLVVTVPNRARRFAKEQAACRDMVAAGVLEEGDILYQRHDASGSIDMFYHLFTPDSFADLLTRSGFETSRMLAESVMPERSVLSLPAGALLDRALMAVVPLNLTYGFAAVATPVAEAA